MIAAGPSTPESGRSSWRIMRVCLDPVIGELGRRVGSSLFEDAGAETLGEPREFIEIKDGGLLRWQGEMA